MSVPHAPAAGETVSGGRLATGHGGKGSNQAVAIRRLGMPVALFTAIGADAAADAALALWMEEGVDADAVVRSADPTMTGFILVDPSGENRIAIADGALESLRAEDLDGFADRIAAADLVVISLEVPSAAAARAAELARAADVPVLLNPAPASADRDLIGMADVLTPNRGELATIVGAPDATVDESLDRLREWFPGRVVVTCGADGTVIDDGAVREHIDAVPVADVVDTTGAGDAFTAALAVALAEGKQLADAARFAGAAGAWAVGFPEVLPGLPARADLDSLLATSSNGAGSP